MESIVCKQQRKEILSLPHSTQLFWIFFFGQVIVYRLGRRGVQRRFLRGAGGREEGGQSSPTDYKRETIKKFTASRLPMIGDHKNIPKPYGGIRSILW